MTILAIGAHSDDIEFYAGGTLAGMAKNHEVIFVIATDGRNGTHKPTSTTSLVKKRVREQHRSAKLIGAKEVIFLGFTDGELEFNTRKLKQKLLELMVKYQPGMIFSFDPEKQHVVHDDFHPDHRILAHAVVDVALIDATLPVKGGRGDFKPGIFLYNPHRANKQINIAPTAKLKRKCLTEYLSQADVIKKQDISWSGESFRFFG